MPTTPEPQSQAVNLDMDDLNRLVGSLTIQNMALRKRVAELEADKAPEPAPGNNGTQSG